jgi:hypothetical protein
MDLDLKIWRPNGTLFAGSRSVDQNFVYIEATTDASGLFTFQIERYENYDYSDISLALVLRGR